MSRSRSLSQNTVTAWGHLAWQEVSMLWDQISNQNTAVYLSCGCAVTSMFSNLACSSLVLNSSLLSPDPKSPHASDIPQRITTFKNDRDRAREFPPGCFSVWLNSTCPKVNSAPPHFPLTDIEKSFKSLRLSILELSITFTKGWGFFLWHVFYSQFFPVHFFQLLSLCLSRLTSGLLLQLPAGPHHSRNNPAWAYPGYFCQMHLPQMLLWLCHSSSPNSPF